MIRKSFPILLATWVLLAPAVVVPMAAPTARAAQYRVVYYVVITSPTSYTSPAYHYGTYSNYSSARRAVASINSIPHGYYYYRGVTYRYYYLGAIR